MNKLTETTKIKNYDHLPLRSGRRNLGALSVVITALALSACSVANFPQPIKTFQAATAVSQQALVEANKALTDHKAATLKALATHIPKGKVRPDWVPVRSLAKEVMLGTNQTTGGMPKNTVGCQQDSDSCSFMLVKAEDYAAAQMDCTSTQEDLNICVSRSLTNSTSIQKYTVPPRPVLSNSLSLMAGMKAYADNLLAIVEADTTAQVATHVDAAVGSLQEIAAGIEKTSEEVTKAAKDPIGGGPEKPKVTNLAEYAAPTAEAIKWVVGVYVDSVKFDALQRATQESVPIVNRVSQLFAAEASLSEYLPRESYANAVTDQEAVFSDKPSPSNYQALLGSAATYQEALSTRSSQVFESMRTSHAILVDRIQNGEGTMASVIADLQRYFGHAHQLYEIMKQFNEISKNQATNTEGNAG